MVLTWLCSREATMSGSNFGQHGRSGATLPMVVSKVKDQVCACPIVIASAIAQNTVRELA